MRIFIRSLVALVIGYGLIVVLTTFGFDLIHDYFGTRHTWGSPPAALVAATVLTVAAGMAGGLVAALIGALRPIYSAALVLLPLTADTTYVLFFYNSNAPFWFELLGGLTLMAATLGGGFVREWQLLRGGEVIHATRRLP